MANQYGSMPITGKYGRKQTQPRSTAMQAAIVSATEIAKADSVLNDITKSGKQPGAVFITRNDSGDLNFAIAVGASATDAWHGLTRGTVITPA